MDRASRIFVRDAGGRLHRPMAFEGWHCDQPIAPDPSALGGAEKAPLLYMAQHPGAPGSGEPLAVLRRTYVFADGVAEPTITDEPLMRCTARPVRGSHQLFLWQRY